MLHQNCDVDSSSFSFGLIHLAFGRCGWMEVFSKFSEMRSLCLILVYFVLYLNTARGKLMHPDTYLNIVSNPYTQKYKASWRLYTRYLILIGLNFLYEFENNSFTFVFSNKNGFFSTIIDWNNFSWFEHVSKKRYSILVQIEWTNKIMNSLDSKSLSKILIILTHAN